MNKEQKTYLLNLCILSKHMYKPVYKRITWAIEMFREQYPEIGVLELQTYLIRYKKLV